MFFMMNIFFRTILLTCFGVFVVLGVAVGKPAFRVLAILSGHPDHNKMMTAAKPFLESLAAKNNFAVDITADTSKLNDANLAQYQVIVQVQLAPFDMTREQQDAMEKFVRQGKGWVACCGPHGKRFSETGGALLAMVREPHGGGDLFATPRVSKRQRGGGGPSAPGDAKSAGAF
jgi:hypothetical protein